MKDFKTTLDEVLKTWMEENPCEDGHDHVTPFDKFYYGNYTLIEPAGVGGDTLTPSEAVTAFGAWLTCRPGTLVVGATHTAAPMAEACAGFYQSQGLAPPRDHFHTLLKPYPDDPEAATQPPAEAQAQAQGGGEVVAWHVVDECGGLIANYADEASAREVASRWENRGSRVRPLVYGDTAPPSAPVGASREATAWLRERRDAVASHFPASPWLAHMDEILRALAQQPAPVAPVGAVQALPAKWRATAKIAALNARPIAPHHMVNRLHNCADELDAAIAYQQPAAVDGAMWKFVADAFDNMTRSESERFLELLRLPDGPPWLQLHWHIQRALAAQPGGDRHGE